MSFKGTFLGMTLSTGSCSCSHYLFVRSCLLDLTNTNQMVDDLQTYFCRGLFPTSFNTFTSWYILPWCSNVMASCVPIVTDDPGAMSSRSWAVSSLRSFMTMPPTALLVSSTGALTSLQREETIRMFIIHTTSGAPN